MGNTKARQRARVVEPDPTSKPNRTTTAQVSKEEGKEATRNLPCCVPAVTPARPKPMAGYKCIQYCVPAVGGTPKKSLVLRRTNMRSGTNGKSGAGGMRAGKVGVPAAIVRPWTLVGMELPAGGHGSGDKFDLASS